MRKHTKRYDLILILLNGAGWMEKYDTTVSNWLKCVAGALYLEYKFKNEVALAGKQIMKHTEKFGNKGLFKDVCIEFFNKTYDVNHPLRNNIETLDNIEEVRLFLKDKNLSEVVVLEPNLLWKVA